MNRKKLSQILYERARAIINAQEDPNAPGYSDLMDDAEMLKVLSRILDGRSIESAFGAPGDWGYGTPIGEAIRERVPQPTNFREGDIGGVVDAVGNVSSDADPGL